MVNNTADNGGGIYCYGVFTPTTTNCTFSANSAIDGGAVYNTHFCEPAFVNCIFLGDTVSGSGQEIYEDGTPALISYFYIQGGFSGTGNIDSNPRLVSGTEGDYYLDYTTKALSPCIDAANDNANFICFSLPGTQRCLDKMTTRTDGLADLGQGDMGTHYNTTILYVPDQFDTIQSAIDAAEDYQTIVVDDGTYTGDRNTNLDFNGKPPAPALGKRIG